MASGIYNPALAESAERGIELLLAPYLNSTTRKSKPLSESDVRHVSEGLYRMGRESWSRVPRIYAVLRMINQVQVIDAFITQGISDLWFPFSHKTLPECLRSPSSRFDFLEVQDLILTKALDLEREDGKHRHFAKAEQIPLRKIEELGKGGFGYVDRVISTITYKEYARKLIPRGRTFKKNLEVLKDFERELGHLKKLSHIHIVELIGSYTDSKFVGIIMSPVAEYNLKDFLAQEPIPPGALSFLRSFFGCLAAALSYLHNNQIRHKDVKPQNVLVKGHQIFLTDFGISLDWSDLTQSTTSGPTVKTPRYCAPEVAENLPRNTFADVWSLGCVFLEIWTALKGEKIASLINFLERNGTKSTCYYANQKTAVMWCTMLEEKNGTSEENPPFPWILGMLHPDQDDRWTAHKLCEQIQEVNEDPDIRYTFSGLCCIHDDDESSESPYSSKRSSRNLEETGASSVGAYDDLSKNHRHNVEAPISDLSSSQTIRPPKQLTHVTDIAPEEIPGQSEVLDQSTTADQRLVSLQESQQANLLTESSGLPAGLEQQSCLGGRDSPLQVSLGEEQGDLSVEEDSSPFPGSKDLHSRELVETAKPMSSSSQQGYTKPIASSDYGEIAPSKAASDIALQRINSISLDPYKENLLPITKSEFETHPNAHLNRHTSPKDVVSISGPSVVQNEHISEYETSPDLSNVQNAWSGSPEEGEVREAIITASDQTRSSLLPSYEHGVEVIPTQEDEAACSDNANRPAISSEGLDQKEGSRRHRQSLFDNANCHKAIEAHHNQVKEAAIPSLPEDIIEWPGKMANKALHFGVHTQPEETDTHSEVTEIPEEQSQSASFAIDEDITIQDKALGSVPRLAEHQILASPQESGYTQDATFPSAADASNIVTADTRNDKNLSTPEQAEAGKMIELMKQNSIAAQHPRPPLMDLHRKFSFEENSEDLRPKVEEIDTESSSDSTDIQSEGKMLPVQPPDPASQTARRPCTGCQEAITGRFVRALGGVFHLECFRCQDCDLIVATKFFPVDDENDNAQFPLCERDYFRRLRLLCFACGQALRESYITALGDRKYHMDHFCCEICGVVFGAQESYYEHESHVFCRYHYSTRYAQKCGGCSRAILQQFVESSHSGKHAHWHPECFMIDKFWNVRLDKVTLPLQNNANKDVSSGLLSPDERAIAGDEEMEAKTSLIWNVLSTFEERAATKISDMFLHITNGANESAFLDTHGFISYIATLFSAIDSLNGILVGSNIKAMSFDREATILCQKLVSFLAFFWNETSILESGKKLEITQELNNIITSLAHYLRLLTRIALQGALRIDGETFQEDGLRILLDAMRAAMPTKNPPETESALAVTAKLAAAQSNQCPSCSQPVKDACIRLQDMRWHEKCFNCHFCKTNSGSKPENLRFRLLDNTLCCSTCVEHVTGSEFQKFELVTRLQQYVFLLYLGLGRVYNHRKMLIDTKLEELPTSPPDTTISPSQNILSLTSLDKTFFGEAKKDFLTTIREVTARTTTQSQKLMDLRDRAGLGDALCLDDIPQILAAEQAKSSRYSVGTKPLSPAKPPSTSSRSRPQSDSRHSGTREDERNASIQSDDGSSATKRVISFFKGRRR